MLPVLNKKVVHNCMHCPYPHKHCIIFYENNQQSTLKLLPLKETHGVFPGDRFFFPNFGLIRSSEKLPEVKISGWKIGEMQQPQDCNAIWPPPVSTLSKSCLLPTLYWVSSHQISQTDSLLVHMLLHRFHVTSLVFCCFMHEYEHPSWLQILISQVNGTHPNTGYLATLQYSARGCWIFALTWMPVNINYQHVSYILHICLILITKLHSTSVSWWHWFPCRIMCATPSQHCSGTTQVVRQRA